MVKIIGKTMKAASSVRPRGLLERQTQVAKKAQPPLGQRLLPVGAEARGDMMSLVFITFRRGDRKTRPRGGKGPKLGEKTTISSLLDQVPEIQE